MQGIQDLFGVYGGLKQTIIDMHKEILDKNKSDADKTEVERTLDEYAAEMATL